jgi:hypothetical protein
MDKKFYTISHREDSIELKIKTPLRGELVFSLPKPTSSSIPTSFFTATATMKDFIGNIVSINGKHCIVKGVYEGIMREVKNIEIVEENIKNIGDRVMVTEHINTCGTFELLASKKRILMGDINFINIGWKTDNKTRYMRVDIYTGNYKIIED